MQGGGLSGPAGPITAGNLSSTTNLSGNAHDVYYDAVVAAGQPFDGSVTSMADGGLLITT